MSRQSNSGEVVPERAEIEAVAEAIRGTYVALGTRSGLFGSVGLLDERSRIRIAEVILDRVRDARGDEAVPACVREYHAMLAGDVDFLRAQRAKARADIDAARSPQGEDHEAGIEAAITAHYGASERERFERSIAAYLARVSAPKADEKAPSEQNADGG